MRPMASRNVFRPTVRVLRQPPGEAQPTRIALPQNRSSDHVMAFRISHTRATAWDKAVALDGESTHVDTKPSKLNVASSNLVSCSKHAGSGLAGSSWMSSNGKRATLASGRFDSRRTGASSRRSPSTGAPGSWRSRPSTTSPTPTIGSKSSFGRSRERQVREGVGGSATHPRGHPRSFRFVPGVRVASRRRGRSAAPECYR